MDAISIGTTGMLSAARQFDTSALRAVSGGEAASALVGQTTSKLDFEASAKVVKTADQMMGRLLDTFA